MCADRRSLSGEDKEEWWLLNGLENKRNKRTIKAKKRTKKASDGSPTERDKKMERWKGEYLIDIAIKIISVMQRLEVMKHYFFSIIYQFIITHHLSIIIWQLAVIKYKTAPSESCEEYVQVHVVVYVVVYVQAY